LHQESGAAAIPSVAAPATLVKERAGMNPYYGRTQQFFQFKIPLRLWAVIALAMGVFVALIIVFASIDI
jgi:hypothetical protein